MLDDEVERLIAGILEATANLARGAFNEYNARIAALEAELASLRQIVADVETCRGVGVENGVTIFGAAEIALVALTWPALHDDRAFEASTWQAALHAAAEHVRNTNPDPERRRDE